MPNPNAFVKHQKAFQVNKVYRDSEDLRVFPVKLDLKDRKVLPDPKETGDPMAAWVKRATA